jgi:hypothetical protein
MVGTKGHSGGARPNTGGARENAGRRPGSGDGTLSAARLISPAQKSQVAQLDELCPHEGCQGANGQGANGSGANGNGQVGQQGEG